MSSIFHHGYALLIGVGQTIYLPWSLPVSVRDTLALRATLTNSQRCAYPDTPDHIRVLHNAGATQEAILKGIDWLAATSARDADATAILFYSGHGWCDPAGNYYLIPHDADPLDIANSAIVASRFAEALQRVHARRLLVILDCCHAAAMVTSKECQPAVKLPPGLRSSAPPQMLIDQLKQGQGRAIFTSSRSEQVSLIRPDGQLSLYTYYLLEALQGSGSHPGDTVVRLSALMAHLGQGVSTSAQMLGHVQTPFFDTATEDFAVALLNGADHAMDEAASPPRPTTEPLLTLPPVIINNATNQGAQGIFNGPITFQIAHARTDNASEVVTKGLGRDERIAEQERLLAAYRQTLAILLEQCAKLGSAWAPPGTIAGIAEARAAIRHIKQNLRASQYSVADHPNDEPLHDETIS